MTFVICLHAFVTSVVRQQRFEIVDMTKLVENSPSMHFKDLNKFKLYNNLIKKNQKHELPNHHENIPI